MSGPHRRRPEDTLPAVGRDIEAWCSKCARAMEHVILAMAGHQILQVRCRTCGGTHRFKTTAEVAQGSAPKRKAVAAAPRPATTSAARTAAPRPAAEPLELRAARELWRRWMAERDRATAVRYHIGLSPTTGTLLDHGQFGYGVVESLLDGKARVLFEDGYRILVIGR
jgi:hypothetical protein